LPGDVVPVFAVIVEADFIEERLQSLAAGACIEGVQGIEKLFHPQLDRDEVFRLLRAFAEKIKVANLVEQTLREHAVSRQWLRGERHVAFHKADKSADGGLCALGQQPLKLG